MPIQLNKSRIGVIQIGSTNIIAVKHGSSFVFTKGDNASSCFGSGVWYNAKPWLNSDSWKNSL